MLNYMITIAISAFFVPHYIGGIIGSRPLRHAPGDIFFGIGVVDRAGRSSTSSASRSRRACNVALAVVDFLTQLLLVLVGLFLVLDPGHARSTTSTSVSRRRGRTSSWRSRSA